VLTTSIIPIDFSRPPHPPWPLAANVDAALRAAAAGADVAMHGIFDRTRRVYRERAVDGRLRLPIKPVTRISWLGRGVKVLSAYASVGAVR